MALLSTPLCNYGEKMPNFELMNIDNSFINQEMIKGKNGTLIFFICNHCPYVKAITKKLVYTVNEIAKLGISSVGIMPNDTIKYPEDNFDNMRKFFNNNKLNFPYLIDSDQSVSRSFGAVCTPDFFGYNSKNELQYRGRIAEMNNLKFANDKNDLLDAMIEISRTQTGPKNQFASAGCSIKWK
jgi:peroxiredoxin